MSRINRGVLGVMHGQELLILSLVKEKGDIAEELLSLRITWLAIDCCLSLGLYPSGKSWNL